MKNRLYVGNLPYDIDEAELSKAFMDWGYPNTNAKIIRDKERENASKGFGFVDLADDAAATQAVANLNGADFGGRSLRLDIAQPMTPKAGGERFTKNKPSRDSGAWEEERQRGRKPR